MDQTTFNAKNISDGDKSRFLNAFNEARTSVQMAFFEADGTCYTATNENGPYGPLFKLCSTGFKNFKAIANYDVTSAGERGAMMLHGVTCELYKAGPGSSQKIAAKTFKSVEIKVAKDLRSEYPIPDNVSQSSRTSSPKALPSRITENTRVVEPARSIGFTWLPHSRSFTSFMLRAREME